MGASVKVLSKEGWSAEAIARSEAAKESQRAHKAFQAAKAAHPLARTLEGLTDASWAASEAPRLKVISRDFGNGHREAVVMREIPDIAKTLDRAIEQDLRTLRGEGDREKSVEASVRRAKQGVRHKCKAMAVNSLWTLTFRKNVTDRALVWKCLDRFRRRVAAMIPNWRYLAVLEKQTRGAYHIHLATHALPRLLTHHGAKVKSWNVMRAIWRRVAGDLGGNFDEAKRVTRHGGKRPFKGAGAIASYIAGYVAKDLVDTPMDAKRYSASKGIELPTPERAVYRGDESFAELIVLAYAAVGNRVTRSWFDAGRGVFFVETDDSDQLGASHGLWDGVKQRFQLAEKVS